MVAHCLKRSVPSTTPTMSQLITTGGTTVPIFFHPNGRARWRSMRCKTPAADADEGEKNNRSTTEAGRGMILKTRQSRCAAVDPVPVHIFLNPARDGGRFIIELFRFVPFGIFTPIRAEPLPLPGHASMQMGTGSLSKLEQKKKKKNDVRTSFLHHTYETCQQSINSQYEKCNRQIHLALLSSEQREKDLQQQFRLEIRFDTHNDKSNHRTENLISGRSTAERGFHAPGYGGAASRGAFFISHKKSAQLFISRIDWSALERVFATDHPLVLLLLLLSPPTVASTPNKGRDFCPAPFRRKNLQGVIKNRLDLMVALLPMVSAHRMMLLMMVMMMVMVATMVVVLQFFSPGTRTSRCEMRNPVRKGAG
uniref:Uncharacterized protein n=1 Tax=Anopheles farauti TaxID=69004 RepID=A0A182Q6N3_9DIPT